MSGLEKIFREQRVFRTELPNLSTVQCMSMKKAYDRWGYFLVCDGVGCHKQVRVPADKWNGDVLRAQVRKEHGWATLDGRNHYRYDYCPKCKALN